MCRSTTTGKHPTGRTQRNKPTNDIRTTTTSFPCPSILPYNHHHKYQRGVGQKPRKQTPPSIDRKSSKRQVIISQPTSESSRRDAWRVRYSYILSIYVFIFNFAWDVRTHTHTRSAPTATTSMNTTTSSQECRNCITLHYMHTYLLFVCCETREKTTFQRQAPRRSSPMILVGPFPAFAQNSHTHTQYRETTTEWNEAAAGHTVNGIIIIYPKGRSRERKDERNTTQR